MLDLIFKLDWNFEDRICYKMFKRFKFQFSDNIFTDFIPNYNQL